MPRAQSSPRSPSPLPSPPPPPQQQEAQTQKTQQQQQDEEGKQEDLAVMAQVLAKYHSLPSAERDKLSPVFAGVRMECTAHHHVHAQRAMHVTFMHYALRMGSLPAGLLQEKAIPRAAEPPRVWPSEVHTCIEL